jgi:EpsI family protein
MARQSLMRRFGKYLPALLFGGGLILLARVHEQHDAPLRRPLAELPDTMLGYRGADVAISPEEQRVAGVSTYSYRAFARDSLIGFSVYVGYYPSQTQGRTIHSPKNCLPGAGWEPVSAGSRLVETAGGPFRVNRYVIAKGPVSALVYYWYQGRGRVAWDEFRVKLDLLTNKASTGRSEEALVRVLTPITGTEAAADSLAGAIAGRLIPSVFGILPSYP